MAGVTITVDESVLKAKIAKIIAGLANAAPLMRLWGEIAQTSIAKNFEVGGRPKWPALKKSTVDRKGHDRILQGRTSNLRRIAVKPERSRVILGTHPSARAYASIHQKGGTINHPGGTSYFIGAGGLAKFVSSAKAQAILAQSGSRLPTTAAHPIKIPARPYLVLQDEDVREMTQAARAYLAKLAV